MLCSVCKKHFSYGSAFYRVGRKTVCLPCNSEPIETHAVFTKKRELVSVHADYNEAHARAEELDGYMASVIVTIEQWEMI